MSSDNKNIPTYASDLTHESFPIIERLGEFAHRDIAMIFSISPNDLLDVLSASDKDIVQNKMDLERQLSNKEITPSQYKNAVGDVEINLGHLAQITFQNLFPEHYNIIKHDINWESAGDNLLKGIAACKTIDMDITAKDSYILIVTTPHNDATKEELASLVSVVLSPKDMKNIAGTDEDWHNSYLIHEVNHNTDHSEHGLSTEILADKKTMETWSTTFNTTSNNSHLVPEIDQSLRALASFNYAWIPNSHITNAAIQSGNEGTPPNGSEGAFISQLKDAKNITFINQAANSTFHPHVYTNPATNLIFGNPSIEGGDMPIISKEEEAILKEMVARPNADDFFNKMHSLSDGTKNAIFNYANIELTAIGEVQALTNPAAFYKTTYNLYQEGSYDHIPIGKQYAYEFLVAAHKFSEKYETQGFDQSAIIAPIFDDSGRHTAPSDDLSAAIRP